MREIWSLKQFYLTFRRLTVLRPEGRTLVSCFSDMLVTSTSPSSTIKARNISATLVSKYMVKVMHNPGKRGSEDEFRRENLHLHQTICYAPILT